MTGGPLMSATEGSGTRESGLQRAGSEAGLWLEWAKASWVGKTSGRQ
jgi:hypothetical protein